MAPYNDIVGQEGVALELRSTATVGVLDHIFTHGRILSIAVGRSRKHKNYLEERVMRARKVTPFVAILALFLAGPGLGAITLIDFEAYAGGQDISGLNLGGVTLTSPGGAVTVYANNAAGAWYRSPVNSVSPWPSSNILIGTFDSAVNIVSLWGGDEGIDTDSWTLNVYDAAVGGTLLGSVSSPAWNGNPYEQLSLSVAGIMRFEAVDSGGIAYDDLSFGVDSVIPAPGAILLVGVGAGLVARLRQRRML